MKIPLLDLKKQYKSIQKEIDLAIHQVLESSQFILGENVSRLEEEVAGFCGVRYGIGVASGTDALILSLEALGIGEGDEVITTPFTFIATTEAICQVGAKPVFVDIEPETYNLDPSQVEVKITPRTKALLPVNLYGHPCRMDELLKLAKKHRLYLVEDCAQSIGAEYDSRKAGSFGDASAFSFFPSKNLGGYGDGGMILTNDVRLAKRVKVLRVHGSEKKYYHICHGHNSRLDELQAAILRIKLGYLNLWNENRRKNACLYNELFTKARLIGDGVISLPKEAEGCRHVYHIYTVRSPMRNRIAEHLQKAGVSNEIYYPVPLHLQEVYRGLGYQKGDFPVCESAANEVLSIPMYPELSHEEIEFIVQQVSVILSQNQHKC